MNIGKPTLLLDENKCRKNIRNMVSRAKQNKVDFRPHFKTHQSLEVGSWFSHEGVSKITVSSCEMAHYFSTQWNDITIAFPVNILEINTINNLAAKINLNILLESEQSAGFMVSHAKENLGFFIKIDTGSHRTGLLPENKQTINRILEITTKNKLLEFKGFLSHAGHTYNCNTYNEVRDIYHKNLVILQELKQLYIGQFPNLILSTGDTPSASMLEDYEGVDEIRPGNFVFYDLTQLTIGAANASQIAIAMRCPVVAVHKHRNEVVLYGGGIHFSKEYIDYPGLGKIFGLPVKQNTDGTWGKVVEKACLSKLSQEHGILRAPKEWIDTCNIGDTVFLLPVHACMTVSCMKKYQRVGCNFSNGDKNEIKAMG